MSIRICFPWAGRFAGIQDVDFTLPLWLTQSRKLLVGLTGDAAYLGERVSRQHGVGAIARIPVDPPAELWFPRQLPDVDRWIAGEPAEPYMYIGEYQDWVVTELVSPQVVEMEEGRGVGTPGYVESPIGPPTHADLPVEGSRFRRVQLDTRHVQRDIRLPVGTYLCE